ncbi:hypothetical protein [Silvimonas amylolytica]|uniref:Uncharacterized protein n=1 Tax=Silvimonas amylolytica TaxID=449663 RepID=A0ABQ2PQS0_9NEIS|nr:hypothetical protein [Silvimonas amylolytica]GGP27790.1 hypothetical protein GCM10010971_36090 [Silvimonas amylolytica]
MIRPFDVWRNGIAATLSALTLATSATWGYMQTQGRLEGWLVYQQQLEQRNAGWPPLSPLAHQQLAVWAQKQSLQGLRSKDWTALAGHGLDADFKITHAEIRSGAKAAGVNGLYRSEFLLDFVAWARHEEALEHGWAKLAGLPGLLDVQRCSYQRENNGISMACSVTISGLSTKASP